MRKFFFLLGGFVLVGIAFFLAIGAGLNLNVSLPFPDLGLPCLLNCELEPAQVSGTVIRERIEKQGLLQAASRLYTYKLTLTSTDYYFSNPQVSYDAVVKVTAVIDLAALPEDAVNNNEGLVTIRLPPPQVMECILDEQASSYTETNCSVLGTGITIYATCEQMKADLRLDALKTAANDDHNELLSIAFESAADTLGPLLADIEGVAEVRFEQGSQSLPMLHPEGACKNYEILPES